MLLCTVFMWRCAYCGMFRLPNWVAETFRSNLNNNKLINEKLICTFRCSVLPSIMKMHGPKNKIIFASMFIRNLQGVRCLGNPTRFNTIIGSLRSNTVKQYLHRPLGFQEVETPRISRQ